jgi:Dolichyl-phosphate-mannose-protein mannosyltransferase
VAATASSPLLQRFEPYVLCLLICAKTLLLARFWDTPFGYDMEPHLAYVTTLAEHWQMPAIIGDYYAYHPPAGFLLAALIMKAGFSAAHGAMLVSFLSSLCALLFLRATVRALGLLHKPVGFAFLYLAAGIPLQVYMSVAVGLDIVILCIASAILYFSVRIVLQEKPHRLLPAYELSIYLLLGLLAKYTGVLLLALPFLWQPLIPRERLKRTMSVFALSAGVAVLAAAPYYLLRNYAATGSLFYTSAGNTFANPSIEKAVTLRDAGLPGFTARLVLPPQAGHPQPTLLYAWSGLWRMADRAPQSALAVYLSHVLSFFGAVLACVGTWRILRRTREDRLGVIFLAIAALFAAFLIYYAFRFPVFGHFSVKTIYVAPALWAVCYGMARAMYPLGEHHHVSQKDRLLLIGVGGFALLTHLLPVF